MPISSSLATGTHPGGGRVLNKCLCPEVQLLTLLHTIFHKQGTPFLYVLLANGIPFTYLV